MIGNTVNLAARLESERRFCRELDSVEVKSKQQAIVIYEVFN